MLRSRDNACDISTEFERDRRKNEQRKILDRVVTSEVAQELEKAKPRALQGLPDALVNQVGDALTHGVRSDKIGSNQTISCRKTPKTESRSIGFGVDLDVAEIVRAS